MPRGPATDSIALVNAAAKVFDLKGYRNATIDDIADAAGVSRPTVYKYTNSKRALLDSMVDLVLDTITDRLSQALTAQAPPEDKLRRVIDIHVQTATTMSTYYAIVFSEQAELSEQARQRFHSFSHNVATDFQRLLDECIHAGAAAQGVDTWIAANLILSMLTALYRWYNPAGQTPPDQLQREILTVIGTLVPNDPTHAR